MKLEGIRVVDLSSFLPGPYLSLALADHGAEVIKVEAPDGDHGRRIGLADGPSTVFFRNLNRGKRSLRLDLKSEPDRERLLRLCETADVFLETYRPGVAARLGVGYEQVRAVNPRIVYCSISAFGQDGPNALRPAHDLAVQASCGVLSTNLGSDGKPALPALPVSDLTAGLHGLTAVLMALLRREKTGEGDYIDLSMQDSLMGAMLNVLGPTFAEHRQPIAQHERTTGGSAFYRLYETSDGRQIALAGQESKFIRNLLGALGRPDLVPLCERGPGPHQMPVVEFLAETFATKPAAYWHDWLGGLDLCWGPVRTMVEAIEDPHLAARGTLIRDSAGRIHVASPIRFQNEPAELRLEPPALGEFDSDPPS